MSYQKQQDIPLRNTIEVHDNDDREFAVCPPGQHALALVRIKNCTVKNEWGTKPGYRFVFRPKGNPEAFVNVTVTSIWSSRSNFGKLVYAMSGASVDIESLRDSDAVFNYIQRFKDHWFLGNVEHNNWTPPSGGEEMMFVRIANNLVQPHPQDKEWGNATEYFRKGSTKKDISAPVQDTGFEEMPDEEEAAQNGKGSKSVSKGSAKKSAIHYGPHTYNIPVSDDEEKQAKQIRFLIDSGGQYNEATKLWHFDSEVKVLSKYYEGLWEEKKTPVSFDDDDIPF